MRTLDASSAMKGVRGLVSGHQTELDAHGAREVGEV